MQPSDPVRIVDKNGNPVDSDNPLYVTDTGGGGGGASEVNVSPSGGSYTTDNGSASTSGTHSIVAAPSAGSANYVRILVIENLEETQVTGEIRSGATKEMDITIDPESAFVLEFDSDNELEFGDAEAVNVNIGTDWSIRWWVQYRVDTVSS